MEDAFADSTWTLDRINAWYRAQPMRLGANYLPSSAINQLEMWQAETFDEAIHRRELGWAAAIGMNTMRVFLHDLLWEHDAEGFKRRIDAFLHICADLGIQPCLVFFDDCHRPYPRPGPQPQPLPGIHNSGWVQSPGVERLHDEGTWPLLERYVQDILRTFGQDERICFWDLYNEPTNGGFDGNHTKQSQSVKLVERVFDWAREVAPLQPLTVGPWADPFPLPSSPQASPFDEETRLRADVQHLSLRRSDFVTFHHYGPAEPFRHRIGLLKALGRPVVCTEYMARKAGSRFETHCPVLTAEGVWGYNWGLVAGKSQTIFPWGSPEGAPEPQEWFHDLFHTDGTPYNPAEIAAIQAAIAR